MKRETNELLYKVFDSLSTGGFFHKRNTKHVSTRIHISKKIVPIEILFVNHTKFAKRNS